MKLIAALAFGLFVCTPALAQQQRAASPPPAATRLLGSGLQDFATNFNALSRRLDLPARTVQAECQQQAQIVCQYRIGRGHALVRARKPEETIQEVLFFVSAGDNSEAARENLSALEVLMRWAEPEADWPEIRTAMRGLMEARSRRQAITLRNTTFEVNSAQQAAFISINPARR